ncbi:MAG: CvpA family protein [Planctomycetota bacterium]|nr:MAG: CvpA family protein [Planctomycetota bacterium]
MGLYDLFVAVVAAFGYGIGRHRGLVWQASGLGTLLVGGLCASVLCRPLGPLFAENPVLGRFSAWIVVYALVAVCLYVLTLKLKHKIEELEFEELDRRFGGVLGACKGLCVFALLSLVGVGLSEGVAGAVRRSASGRVLGWVVHSLEPLLPERIHDAVWPYLEERLPGPGAVPSARGTPPAAPRRSPTGPRRLPEPREVPPPRSSPPRPAPAPSAPVGRLPAGARAPEGVGAPEAGPDPVLDYPLVPDAPPVRAAAGEAPSQGSVGDPFDTREDPPDPLAPPR